MKYSLKILFVIITAITFSSCDILDSDGSSISPLDSKINFKVIESYDNYETVSSPEIFVGLISEKNIWLFQLWYRN